MRAFRASTASAIVAPTATVTGLRVIDLADRPVEQGLAPQLEEPRQVAVGAGSSSGFSDPQADGPETMRSTPTSFIAQMFAR